jgi:hypothetical protein
VLVILLVEAIVVTRLTRSGYVLGPAATTTTMTITIAVTTAAAAAIAAARG